MKSLFFVSPLLVQGNRTLAHQPQCGERAGLPVEGAGSKTTILQSGQAAVRSPRPVRFPFFLLPCLSLLLLVTACGPKIETIEEVDALGYKTTFQVDPATGQKQGVSQQFDPQGNLVYEEMYVDDRLNGQRKIYGPEGNLLVLENYVDDQFAGEYLNYDEEGNLTLKGQYINGAMNKAWFQYYADGKVMESVTFVDNATRGPFREWYENGMPKASGVYAPESKEDGLLHLYLETGGLERVMQCSIGMCQTVWTPDSTGTAPEGVDMTRPE